MGFISRLVSRMEHRSRDLRDRATLHRMSDRELSDIGISRLEIDAVFKKGKK